MRLSDEDVFQILALKRQGASDALILERFADRQASTHRDRDATAVTDLEPGRVDAKAGDLKPGPWKQLVPTSEFAIDGATNVMATCWSPDDKLLYMLVGDVEYGDIRNHYEVKIESGELRRILETPEWANETLTRQAGRLAPGGAPELVVKVKYSGAHESQGGLLVQLIGHAVQKKSKNLPVLRYHLGGKEIGRQFLYGQKHFIERDENEELLSWERSWLPLATYMAWSDTLPALALTIDGPSMSDSQLLLFDPAGGRPRRLSAKRTEVIAAPSWAHQSVRLAVFYRQDKGFVGKVEEHGVHIIDFEY